MSCWNLENVILGDVASWERLYNIRNDVLLFLDDDYGLAADMYGLRRQLFSFTPPFMPLFLHHHHYHHHIENGCRPQWPLYPRHKCIVRLYQYIYIINTKLYCGSWCLGDLFCNRTVLLDLAKTYLNGFKGINSFSRNDMIRQTVPYGNNLYDFQFGLSF